MYTLRMNSWPQNTREYAMNCPSIASLYHLINAQDKRIGETVKNCHIVECKQALEPICPRFCTDFIAVECVTNTNNNDELCGQTTSSDQFSAVLFSHIFLAQQRKTF